MTTVEQLRFGAEGGGEVSALLCRPAEARRLLVLAHGAGAGMSHPFMEKLAGELAGSGVATLRYQFPYIEERRRVPDAPGVLIATVVAAVRAAAAAAPGLALKAGGKTTGGRNAIPRWGRQPMEGRRRIGIFCFSAPPPVRA